MGRGDNMASSILYGDAMRPPAEHWWLVPAPEITGEYPPLHDVPVSDRLLADLEEIPQTLTDHEKTGLIADLEWRRDQGWGVYCGYMGPVGKPERRQIDAPGPEPRFLLPTATVIRVMVSIPEFVDTSNEAECRAPYRSPGKFRITSMGLPEFDPWNPDALPDPS